jgi:hypothetical protein
VNAVFYENQKLTVCLKHYKKYTEDTKILLFSIANPLFFKISDIITTVAIAANIT